MDKNQAKALKEFVAEAEEILEGLSEDLEAAHEQFESARKVRPDRVNKIFREMHSLKGLASMLGLERITKLSHGLESLLDRVRMGKTPFSPGLFGLLDESRKMLRQLATEAGQGKEVSDIAPLLAKVEQGCEVRAEAPEQPSKLLLDEQTMKSLTEYEEHRLRENVEDGNRLYSIKAGFSFSDFDVRLRALAEKLGALGEVISTLPVVDPSITDGLHFRLLFGTNLPIGQVEAEVASDGAVVTDILPPDPSAKAAKKDKEPKKPVEEPANPDTKAATEVDEAEDVRGLSDSVKVSITKLDAVMGIVGELNLINSSLERSAANMAADPALAGLHTEISRSLRPMNKKLDELQRAILDIRMVPIGQIFTRLNRTARRLARQANKQVAIQLYGGETELDKMMIDQLVTPLIHIIRNSIDHGIETVEERQASGKPADGQVTISAFQKGNSIVIEASDDGRGLQYQKIKEAAVKKGLVKEDASLGPEECLDLIFLPGFSSSEEVTEVSGRGVGLDAVKTSVEAMKGAIAVWSEPGKGAVFQITLPITLAIIQSLIVGCCGQSFAIPISSVVETFLVAQEEIDWVDQREVYSLRGATLPLLRLERRFGLKRPGEPPSRHFVVVAHRGDKSAGIVVDDLLGEQETVIHPIGRSLGRVAGVAGATEVGENQVILVLDTSSLLAAVEAERV